MSRVVHFELCADDPERAVKFYEEVFGWKIQKWDGPQDYWLATTGAKRSPFLPNVPTVAESGYPGFEAVNWYAFVAPGKTPTDILEFWNRELTKVLNDPKTSTELAKHGLEPSPGSRDDLARYMAREYDTWGKVVREANIKPE